MDLGLSFLAPIAEQQRMDQAAQLAPAQLAHTLALGLLETAQAQKAEAELAGERQMATAMAQRMGRGAPESMPDFLMDMSGEAMKMGLVDKATKMANTASLMYDRDAQRQAAVDRAEETRLKGKLEKSKVLGDAYYGVSNERDWANAHRIYKNRTGETSPYATLPYTPERAASLSRTALTAKERAELEHKDEVEARQERTQARIERYEQARLGLEGERINIERAREARLRKDGGKDIGEPSPAETAHAKNLLKSQAGLIDPDDLDVAADDLAARARQKRKQAPGLSAEEARRRALMEMKTEGAFQPSTPGKKILGVQTSLGAEKGAYAPAEPLPAKKSDWKVGAKYKDGGVTGIWTGTKFVPVGTKVAPARRSGGTVEEEEPDE